MEYAFSTIEKKWKQYWKDNSLYKVHNVTDKPKYYILDMFPYPSGAGLHVGHPLGYIASDIYARFKRQKGFNVLHPMGFDAFGLPAEQYALETGQHPAVTTEKNIARYKEQLDNIGFCYDWDREVRTSEPNYYKWTQWIFLQLFHSWFDRKQNKARHINELITIFEKEGNTSNTCPEDESRVFDNKAWAAMTEKEKRDTLMQYRLAFQGYAEVWWCEALGTVLANDEVVNGVSERGGHPVVRKQMRQWFLRITEYAERLLTSLEKLDWSDAMKEMQRNWIGKSNGAEVRFEIAGMPDKYINVFTTRPDTIFGVDFMVLAPEHELVDTITTGEQQHAIAEYKKYVQSRSERERMTEVKQVTGCFTGAYVTHPFTRKQVPVWISEYVLAGYGTGAIMAVPSGDERDYAFARHFEIPVTNIFGNKYNHEEAYTAKEGTLENSSFLNGIELSKAVDVAIRAIVDAGIGKGKTNYKMRDAGFSRQRYWGEPFPIVYINGIPYATDELEHKEELPVLLPHVESYKPGPEGEGPLANVTDWVNLSPNQTRETNTMPGYAGSSWYFLRYMDPNNDAEFASKEATSYWREVDLYIGGTEHAVGHLLYSRLWTKVLHDLGYISFDEPFKKLVNQGMIQGSSRFVYRPNTNASETIINKLLNRHFKEYKFTNRYQNSNVVESDFFSEEEGIVIELSSQRNIKEKYERYLNIYGDAIILIALSNEEIFHKFKESEETLINWLKELFLKNVNYCSDNIKSECYISSSYLKEFNDNDFDSIRVDVTFVNGIELNIEAFKKWRPEYTNAEFKLEDGKYICGAEVEKMSKSKYNVVNPDDIVAQFGADSFRMYEMFLGPIDVSKPWEQKGIEGVHRFIKKMWRLYADEQKGWVVTDEPATDAELKVIHKTIKKIGEDIERFSFNTAVSQFMICVNELTTLNCHKRIVLEALAVIIAPFAPHLAEELWHGFGHESSVLDAPFPAYDEKYTTDNSKLYPVAVNGKTRAEMEFPLDMEQALIQKEVLADETIQKWLDGKEPKKFIYVKGKMINVVV